MTTKQLHPLLKDQEPALAKFLIEVDAVCRKHGLSIGHEDGHGAFTVGNYKRLYRNWLYNAENMIKTTPQKQPNHNLEDIL
jgi:hypothetical protein